MCFGKFICSCYKPKNLVPEKSKFPLSCQIEYHRLNRNNGLQTSQSFETFGNFLVLRQNYCANSQVVFNRETRFWKSFLLKRPQPAFCKQKFWILDSLLNVFLELRNFLNLLKINLIKYEKRSGCDSCSCRSGGVFFLREMLSREIDHLKFCFVFSLLFVDQQLRFWAKSIFEITFSCRISIGKSFNIKHVAPALAGPLVVFYRDNGEILVHLVFSTLFFFRFEFFMFVLYHKWRTVAGF